MNTILSILALAIMVGIFIKGLLLLSEFEDIYKDDEDDVS